MDRKTKVTNIYLTVLLPLGLAVLVWACLAVDPKRADFLLGGLIALTLLTGSYLRIQLPRTKIHLSPSDALIFVVFLHYGPQFAVLLGSIEALTSSLHFRRKGMVMSNKTILINVIISVLSVSSMAIAVTLAFHNPEAAFDSLSSKQMVLLLGTMAVAQFLVNSALVSIFISIRSGETLWHVWNEYCLNSLVMYFTGAFLAGVIYAAFSQVDLFLLLAVSMLFCLVYLTYRRYVDDIKATSAKAEDAERQRAEQAEAHVWQLEHYVGELEKSGEALRESREHLLYAAYHDVLTGLANRNQIVELLQPFVTDDDKNSVEGFALLFLDLNRFKGVNDSLGHAIGDLLLLQVAERLSDIVGDRGVVGRLGGDEFVVLLTKNAGREEAVQFAQKINEALAHRYDLDGNLVFSSGNIGIAVGNARYDSPNEILRDADIAMHNAKETNQSYIVFDQIMHARAVTLLELETDLRVAVERSEFELYYQPLVRLHDVSLMGFEALVRWNHPRRGLVTPGEFIAVAESTGLIIPMTTQLLQRACEQAAEWINSGVADPSVIVSVNVSAGHLAQGDLLGDLNRILSEVTLQPRNLKLEITESAVMENAESSIDALNRIRALGVKLSIDDFGTGYSSLSYLHRFPIDTLKVDRSFVSTMDDNSGNGEIVGTIIALARSLRLSVIAEGIESIEQLRRLRSLGCEYGQGYLFSRPVPAVGARKLLESGFQGKYLVEPRSEYLLTRGLIEFDQVLAY